jgi:hypothetical protein
MSTSNPQPPATPPMAAEARTAFPAAQKPPLPPQGQREILVVSHCALFYWWPVWAVGFLMFGITMMFGQHMAIVPPRTTAVYEQIPASAMYTKKEMKEKGIHEDQKYDVLIAPGSKVLMPDPSHPNQPEQPHLNMTANKNLGVLFVAVLLLVIAITNIPLRGLWSVIVIVFIISVVIIFALLDWWDKILTWLGFLDIRINAAGYLVISIVLFALWLVIMLLFDRQVYMVFTPGQMRVRQEIGDAETAFDTAGMTIQKQRSDLFRHWILGLGSGDLIVKAAGAHPQEFQMPNVLFIGRKVTEIEEMLRQKQVVTGRAPQ